MKNFKTKAFTLVELIVVIAIIAILGTVGTLSLTQWFGQAEDANRTAISENLQTAMETSLASDGNLPTPAGDEAKTLSGIWEQGEVTDRIGTQLEGYDMPEDLEFTIHFSKSINGSTYQIAVPKDNGDYIIKGNFNGYFIDNGGSGTGDIYGADNMFISGTGESTITDNDLFDGGSIINVVDTDWELDDLTGLVGEWEGEDDENYVQAVVQGAINGVRVYEAD